MLEISEDERYDRLLPDASLLEEARGFQLYTSDGISPKSPMLWVLVVAVGLVGFFVFRLRSMGVFRRLRNKLQKR